MRALTIILMLMLAAPLFADTRGANLPPPPVTPEQRDALMVEFREKETPAIRSAVEAELEARYRKELETRLAQERDTYASSINNLWMSNAAVWAVLALFIVLQALSARKRMAEIARLKAMREEKPRQ
ncbi:MAG: hypothetical protein IT462_04695 [Planctomycetes bacterium]|nr:hypothetical protein [Planctomycetota bacterium]